MVDSINQDKEFSSSKSKRNTSSRAALIISFIFILGSTLAAVIFWNSVNSRDLTVVAARQVSSGSVLTIDDLKTVEMSGVPNSFSSIDDLLGKVVINRVETGDLIQPSNVSDERQLNKGEIIIGLELGPGGYPTDNLAVGDKVIVMIIDPETKKAIPVASNAYIYDVNKPEYNSASSEMLVSVSVSSGQAASITSAAQTVGGVRLVLRGD